MMDVIGRFVPDVTERMLTQRLRDLDLEKEGTVVRTVRSATPPHVEYDLSDEGGSLAPALQALYDWGEGRARERSLVVEAAQPRPA